MICDVFFLQIVPKLHFITPYFSHRGPVGSPSAWQTRGHGFEPVLVLEIFLVSQPVGREFEPLLRHSFFCNKRAAKNIPVLSGRLVSFPIVYSQ